LELGGMPWILGGIHRELDGLVGKFVG